MKGMTLKHRLYTDYFAAIPLSSEIFCPLGFGREVYAVLMLGNTVMTLLNDFPMCLGLDELYRQMRMCQETLRCCTTTHARFNPDCVLKKKKEATCVFTESTSMYFNRN